MNISVMPDLVLSNLAIDADLDMGSYGVVADDIKTNIIQAAAAADVFKTVATEYTTQVTAYTKLVEFTVPVGYIPSGWDLLNTFRVRYENKFTNNAAVGGCYTKVYRNGVAVGVQQNTTGSWVLKTEDLTDFYAGDTIEVWGRVTNASDITHIRNFTVAGTNGLIEYLPNDGFSGVPTW